jgi:hypothetical protein
MREGSTEPERVAPGWPARGVRPMEVSRERPFWMAHMEAPEPRCMTIRLSEVASCSTSSVQMLIRKTLNYLVEERCDGVEDKRV